LKVVLAEPLLVKGMLRQAEAFLSMTNKSPADLPVRKK
jgi:hypothetical protein